MVFKLKKNIISVKRDFESKSVKENYIDLSRNERTINLEKKLFKTIINTISPFDFRKYPADISEFYRLLSKFIKIKKENIILTQGADGGLLNIFNVFGLKKSKVIHLSPSYGMYPVYCKIFNLQSRPIKLTLGEKNENYYLKLKNKIITEKPSLVAISNPNQPIDVLLDKDQLENICKITYKLNCILIIDEAYFHFCKITAKDLIKKFNNLIIVRTFSKAFGLAGLRVGYCISNKKIIDLLKTIKPNYELNNINIKICKFLLNNIKIMNNYVREIKISNGLLVSNLKKFGYEVYNSNSNSILINLKSRKEASKKYDKLIKNKILVKKLSFEKNKFCIRITSGSKKQIRKVIKIFEKK